MIGGLDLLERGVGVVLVMSVGVIPAVKIDVVFRFPVVWQWLSRNLPAGNTPSVAEGGNQQAIDASVPLEVVFP